MQKPGVIRHRVRHFGGTFANTVLLGPYALLFLFFTMVSDTCQTPAADYAAAAAAGVFLAFVTVEIIRLALWIMRHM